MAEKAMTTPITQVGTVVVAVSDQERALGFYLGTLGFESAWTRRSAAVTRWGDSVPPMFTFRDPDGDRFRVVERE